MRSPLSPPHLLLLLHPFADDLVNGQFHKTCADPLTVTVPLAVIRDVGLMAIDIIGGELLHYLVQLAGRGIAMLVDRAFEVERDHPQHLRSLKHVAMPEESPDTFQLPDHLVAGWEDLFLTTHHGG